MRALLICLRCRMFHKTSGYKAVGLFVIVSWVLNSSLNPTHFLFVGPPFTLCWDLLLFQWGASVTGLTS